MSRVSEVEYVSSTQIAKDINVDASQIAKFTIELVAGHNALVYHRCHKHFDLNYPENIALLEENRKGRVTRTPHGIIKEQR